jgi:hypothetical protein
MDRQYRAFVHFGTRAPVSDGAGLNRAAVLPMKG